MAQKSHQQWLKYNFCLLGYLYVANEQNYVKNKFNKTYFPYRDVEGSILGSGYCYFFYKNFSWYQSQIFVIKFYKII